MGLAALASWGTSRASLGRPGGTESFGGSGGTFQPGHVGHGTTGHFQM